MSEIDLQNNLENDGLHLVLFVQQSNLMAFMVSLNGSEQLAAFLSYLHTPASLSRPESTLTIEKHDLGTLSDAHCAYKAA